MGELVATAEQAGERLDVVLAAAVGSRTHAQRLIEDGRVTVDAAARPKRHRVSPGERIAWDEPEPVPVEAAPDAPFAVAYEDGHLLVVDKPAGVVVHPARGHRSGTLAQAIDGGLLVHRLDRDTSGLLVVAKDEATHNALKDALQRREITREYLALVEGRPPARTGTIDAPVGRDRRSRTRMSTDTDTPREARTHFAIERTLPAHTLLRVTLETGRTHQIRVHLEAIGFPVAGDPEYRGGSPAPDTLGLDRQFLHAARLAFDHPHTGERIDVSSPLPPDLAEALERAGGEG